ncbi:SSI family serine proteinase inhibitor [Actinokineospora alba]|uniref:SSI family serine proteinase inhibitor n=1 Tax=Actinokineospora alba TaxID=504798 RepID=UPI001414D2BD|nr:SSI family serine proteinase inhibitor [Actinokineospora alba]
MRKVLIVAFAAATAVATAQPASATPTSASLVLTYQHEGDPMRVGTLRCGPAGGHHRSPETACAQLAAVTGDFSALLVHQDRACPLYVDPVRVTATGTWDGRRVSYDETFGNACQLYVETGAVFDI